MKYNHLTIAERVKIYGGLRKERSRENIAKELGRCKSTISREIIRNSDQHGYLYPRDSHEQAKQRRIDKKAKKIESNLDLQEFIIEKLKKRHSPHMIAAIWKNENSGQNISHESIYTWIYTSEKSIQMKLYQYLVRSKKARGMPYQRSKTTIKGAVSIHKRPEEINQRKDPGHYECDLIFNKGSMSKNVLTMVDRYTRKSIMILNESKHSETVLGSLAKTIREQKYMVKSITFDNGTEFADHQKLKEEFNIETFFCDPGKPYQKGSIENLNGVIRRYLPFELPAHEITHELVQEAMDSVNNLPRGIFGFMSASQFAQETLHSAFSGRVG